MDNCLGAAGVSVDLFRRNFCLTSDATNFCVSPSLGPSGVVYVLYRKVYSIVTFVGKYGTCVAPGCRRFSRRCGHVVMARRFRDSLPVNDRQQTADDEGTDRAAPTSTPCGRPLYITDEEEDAGLEKLPSDTLRSGQDALEVEVSLRRKRNMLPCSSEISIGEAWNRTADWKALYVQRGRLRDETCSQDLKAIMACHVSMVKRGLVADTKQPLIESHCGTCGQARSPTIKAVFEQGILTTHHPTAPALRVRYCLAWLPCLPSLVSLRARVLVLLSIFFRFVHDPTDSPHPLCSCSPLAYVYWGRFLIV